MCISRNLDSYESVHNFEFAYLGPGVYVLFAGRISDGNIVYIGKSASDVMLRVASHQYAKRFDRVGLIRPTRTDAEVIHNLEHYVLAEFIDRWGELPPLNQNNAHLLPWGPRFNWHSMGRRKQDARFLSSADRVTTRARTIAEIRHLHARLLRQTPCWTSDDAWDEVADRLGGRYSPNTLRQYCSTRHGNERLPGLEGW
jgi:hypothetical protein